MERFLGEHDDCDAIALRTSVVAYENAQLAAYHAFDVFGTLHRWGELLQSPTFLDAIAHAQQTHSAWDDLVNAKQTHSPIVPPSLTPAWTGTGELALRGPAFRAE